MSFEECLEASFLAEAAVREKIALSSRCSQAWMAGWTVLESALGADNVTYEVVLGDEDAGADECDVNLGHDAD